MLPWDTKTKRLKTGANSNSVVLRMKLQITLDFSLFFFSRFYARSEINLGNYSYVFHELCLFCVETHFHHVLSVVFSEDVMLAYLLQIGGHVREKFTCMFYELFRNRGY